MWTRIHKHMPDYTAQWAQRAVVALALCGVKCRE